MKKEYKMKKRISLLLTLLMILALLPVQVFAADSTVAYDDDGGYTVVTIEEDQYGLTRATSTKSGSITYQHYTANDELEWKAVMHATFTYDGSTSSCTSVNSLTVKTYNDTWSLYSKSYSKSGNTATGNVTMAKKLLVGSGKVPITLTLSCDKNGNLS